MEAALRSETGAAAPEPEIVRIGHRFRPRITDIGPTVRAKLALLDRFLSGTYRRMNKDGRFDLGATIDAVDAALDEYEQHGTIDGEPAYKAAFDAKQAAGQQEFQHGQTADGGARTYDANRGWMLTEDFNAAR
jgi:hypothetical protein